MLLRDGVSEDRLRPILAAGFAVRPEDVYMVRDLGELAHDAPVIVHITLKRAGDVRMRLATWIDPGMPDGTDLERRASRGSAGQDIRRAEL